MTLFMTYITIVITLIIGYKIGFNDCKNRLIRRR